MTKQSTQFRGRLSYIQLGSPVPERLARFYADIFGMTGAEERGELVMPRPEPLPGVQRWTSKRVAVRRLRGDRHDHAAELGGARCRQSRARRRQRL